MIFTCSLTPNSGKYKTPGCDVHPHPCRIPYLRGCVNSHSLTWLYCWVTRTVEIGFKVNGNGSSKDLKTL
eukprot:scaffold364559_cov61-Attheya_sp.AAC.2